MVLHRDQVAATSAKSRWSRQDCPFGLNSATATRYRPGAGSWPNNSCRGLFVQVTASNSGPITRLTVAGDC
jgi:hypothetical protein